MCAGMDLAVYLVEKEGKLSRVLLGMGKEENEDRQEAIILRFVVSKLAILYHMYVTYNSLHTISSQAGTKLEYRTPCYKKDFSPS